MKKLFSLLVVSTILFSTTSTFAYATDVQHEPIKSSYAIEFEDSTLDGATILSEETSVEDGRLITVTRYMTKDGLLVIDTFERSAIMLLSDNGTDSATRTRDLGRYGKVTVTGNFQWYTDKSAGIPGVGVAYVRCTSMSASHTVPTGYTRDVWEKKYQSEYQAFETAYAQVSYKIYETKAPMYEISGTVKITCSDDGTISDNA